MRKQLCTTDNYITLCVCVCACLWLHRTAEEGNKKVELNNIERQSKFSPAFTHLSSCIVSAGVFFLSLSSFPPFILPPPQPHPSLHPHIQNYWAVKCEKLQHAWQFIILSNFSWPASSHGERKRERDRERERETERNRLCCLIYVSIGAKQKI